MSFAQKLDVVWIAEGQGKKAENAGTRARSLCRRETQIRQLNRRRKFQRGQQCQELQCGGSGCWTGDVWGECWRSAVRGL